MGNLQLTVPVISVFIFGVSAAAFVALVLTGNSSEGDIFKTTMTVALGAGVGVAVAKPSPTP